MTQKPVLFLPYRLLPAASSPVLRGGGGGLEVENIYPDLPLAHFQSSSLLLLRTGTAALSRRPGDVTHRPSIT